MKPAAPPPAAAFFGWSGFQPLGAALRYGSTVTPPVVAASPGTRHALREIGDGVEVKYAIHPVAGRVPAIYQCAARRGQRAL
jgi:hypothetical protein